MLAQNNGYQRAAFGLSEHKIHHKIVNLLNLDWMTASIALGQFWDSA